MISSQDFERLSAYLDNQLSSREKAALEARLAREPELKATLHELRQTVRALRTLPVVRPPRNFTLSARQLGAAPQRRFFPVLRLATSLAALAMVLAFAGDFALSRTPATAPVQYTTAQRNAAQPTAQEAAGTLALPAAALPVETAPPEATTLAAESAPAAAPSQVMDQGPAGAGATGSAAGTPAPEAETPMAAAVLAASPITTTDTASPPLAAKSAAATAPAPGTATPAAPGEARAALASTEAPPTPAPTPTAAPVLAEAYPPPTSEGTAVPAPAAPAPSLPWRPLEIGLIGLTLLLGIITWLSRRR